MSEENVRERSPEDRPQDSGPDERTLDPAVVRFERAEGRLRMREGEGEWREVGVVRLFPLSDPQRWLAVLDAEQADIGVLCDLDGLGPQQRELIEDELRRRYLTPVVKAITAVRHRGDVTEWSVETDRGPTTIVIRNVREKVKEPLPGHLMIEDAQDNRFEIPDTSALDPASRKLLDLEI